MTPLQRMTALAGIVATSAAVVIALSAIGVALGKTAVGASKNPATLTPAVTLKDRLSTRYAHEPLIDHFAVLRRRAHVATAPGMPAGSLPPSAAAEFGLQLAAATYVSPTNDFGFWLVPGSKGACMAWPEAQSLGGSTSGFVCSQGLGGVDDGGMRVEDWAIRGSDGPALFGLVPDGNASVSLTYADGVTRHIPVVNNAYFVPVAGAGPRTLSVRDVFGRAMSYSAGPS